MATVLEKEELIYTRQKKLREILTQDMQSTPKAYAMPQSVIVPCLVEFLKRHDHPQVQCEAAAVLKNITYGDSKVVIDSGAVPIFVELLKSSSFETREQAAWALGNIAGDSPNIVLNCGALQPLLALLDEHKEVSSLRIGTWTLSNILEGEVELPIEQLEPAVPILASLFETNDEAVLKETCWALLYLSRCREGLIPAIVEAGVISKMKKFFGPRSTPSSVLYPAILTMHSIVMKGDPLDERPLEAWAGLRSVFLNEERSDEIRKDASRLYWMIEDRVADIVAATKAGKETFLTDIINHHLD